MNHFSIWESLIERRRKTQLLKLRVVCAWKYDGCVGIIEEGDPHADVNHGMCLNCSQIFEREERIA